MLLTALALALAQDTLRVPASVAYHDASTEEGEQRALWFGRLGEAGELTCSVELDLDEGGPADLVLRLAGSEVRRHVTGTGHPVTIDFGPFPIQTAGYQRFELAQLSGPPVEPRALLLGGAPLAGAHFNLAPRRNAASVHLFYPLPEALKNEEIDAFLCEVTAEQDPVWTYVMATGWHRGYFPMQVNSETERRIIFSVWDSGEEPDERDRVAEEDRVTLVDAGEGVVTGSFGHEGTGGHSHLVFPWRTGEPQRFLVTATKDDATHTTYAGYYLRPDTRRWMLISSWRAPKEPGLLRGLYSFSENFGGANGHLLRRARYGNQWVRTADGTWHELTRATFSFDGTGRTDRLDRFGGVTGSEFFLSHGGFVEGTGTYGERFERAPASRGRPDVPDDWR